MDVTEVVFVNVDSLLQNDGTLESSSELAALESSSELLTVATDVSSELPNDHEVATNRSILKPLRQPAGFLLATTNDKTIRIEVENETTKDAANAFQRKPVSKVLCCEFDGCERTFTWPAHLKYHLLTHTGSRQYKCPLKNCGKRFYTQQRLNIHLRSHTDNRPFVCSVNGCRKQFTTLGNLKNHMRTHTGERPFVCNVNGCERKFAELSSLKKHSLVHTGSKPFECDVCGQQFSQIGSRNVHKKRKHQNFTSDFEKSESKIDSEEIECNLRSPSSKRDKVADYVEQVIVLKRHEEEANIILSTDGCQLNLGVEEIELGTSNSLEAVDAICDVGHLSNDDDLLDEELSCRTNATTTTRRNANVLVVSEPQPISELTYLST